MCRQQRFPRRRCGAREGETARRGDRGKRPGRTGRSDAGAICGRTSILVVALAHEDAGATVASCQLALAPGNIVSAI